ncbi:MAG: iron ABC transporter [Candidatus Pelagibacter sp. TMED203]|nr:MAG: iron ABC transporter [Candidatus Pelagibacter sp. TMED203]|tara:strand:+ start:1081 stop:2151 length:1071 start_codon:yes stop_codon:yes gene_type:complete
MSKPFFEIKKGNFVASEMNKVNDVDLTIENQGEIVSLLGPSGVGKTTILRTIAGLQKLSSGEIFLKNKLISSNKIHTEPEKRNIALSFQDNSLFPNYKVIDNINFGRKRSNGNGFNYKADDIIKLLHIEAILEKFPHQISAGEAQRVSLARSLMSKPDLLLLDEPFSNIDQSLKEEIQVSVKKLLKKINLTTIIVTHDSYEAFSIADKCGIILNQELKQYDVPYNVHHEPNSIEIANFLNKGVFIDVKVLDSECAVHKLNHEVLGEIRGKLSNNFPSGSNVKLLLQPEDLIHDDQSKLKLEVVDRKFRGTNFIYTLKTKNGEHLPVFVHSHHIHQHEKSEKFGIKTPIYIDHLVCF